MPRSISLGCGVGLEEAEAGLAEMAQMWQNDLRAGRRPLL
jgi:hypothetical protein